jgi:hypothetical protein
MAYKPGSGQELSAVWSAGPFTAMTDHAAGNAGHASHNVQPAMSTKSTPYRKVGGSSSLTRTTVHWQTAALHARLRGIVPVCL